jgi:serine/threonine protein kinase
MGGMAAVFKAYQPTLDRYVAIKVLHPIVASDETFLARFRREARAAAALRHPHIVQVYDFGNDGDRYYMAMEYVGGQTIKQRLDSLREAGERMPLEETVRIITQVADALSHAHELGMVHRDVKPANILVDDRGRAVLSDFGIVHMMEGTRYTLTTVLGTPHYMSPEQGMDQPVDARSDVYSLGAVLYEMLTGQVPFSADTLIAVIFKHVQEPLPPPRTINADIPEAVEQVVIKAMAKNPNDRFASGREMAAALLAAMAASMPQQQREASRFDVGSVTPIVSKESARIPAPPRVDESRPRRRRLSARNASAVGSLLALLGVGITMLAVSNRLTPVSASATPTTSAPDNQTAAVLSGPPAPTVTLTPAPLILPRTTTPPASPTREPTKQVVVNVHTPTPTLPPTPVAPVYLYDAPLLTEPISRSVVAGPLVFLKWQPIEKLQENDWYAIRLVYFQNGEAVYEGDRVKAPEWRIPGLFYHQADGPELLYTWYVFVERLRSDGSTEQVSPESEHWLFHWE